jgi:hypothetical protein
MAFCHFTIFFTLDFELMFKGSDAVERRGVYFAINDEDHPATKLMQSPNKIGRGMAAQISLSVNKVLKLKGSERRKSEHRRVRTSKVF